MSVKKFDAIVISGGGIKGLCSLGALQYEYEKKTYDPDNVSIYAGTSIGSVISLLMICGYTPLEAFKSIYEIDDFLDIRSEGVDVWDFVKFMGLMSIKGFMDKIETLVKSKLGYIPTLKELKDNTGKTLVVPVTNITKMSCEYYTYKTKPNVSCLDAVKFSSNLPFVFQRLRFEDCYIADGGVIDNFPLDYIDNGKLHILGIVSTGYNIPVGKLKLYDYFYSLAVLPIISNTKLRCRNAKSNTKLIELDTKKYPFLPFSISDNDKMEMFSEGYNNAKITDSIIYLNCEKWKDDIHDIT